MITRSDYMNGQASHDDYYGEIARECGTLTLPADTAKIKIALTEDRHMNNIALEQWDRFAEMQRSQIAPHVAKRSNGGCSLSDLVCVLKAAARIRAAD